MKLIEPEYFQSKGIVILAMNHNEFGVIKTVISMAGSKEIASKIKEIDEELRKSDR